MYSSLVLFYDSRKRANGCSLLGGKACHVMRVKPVSVNQSLLVLISVELNVTDKLMIKYSTFFR
jgi:hypothetical protein